jgi:hypothetical protein
MDAAAITSAAQAVHQELVRKLAEQARIAGGPAGPGLDGSADAPGVTAAGGGSAALYPPAAPA